MHKFFYLGVLFLGVSSAVMAKTPVLSASWTGMYNDEQKISLFIKQNGAVLNGYSILNGKETKFNGKVNSDGVVTLNEVGKGASVGVFNFKYSSINKVLDGSWVSSTGAVKPKFFSINAQQCRYAKGRGEFSEASVRLLKDADLQIPLGQLQYMRNEIYARHGYAFKDKDWARRFSLEDWYMPCYTDVEKRLSNIEKQNIQRIKMVEPYAEEGDWGR